MHKKIFYFAPSALLAVFCLLAFARASSIKNASVPELTAIERQDFAHALDERFPERNAIRPADFLQSAKIKTPEVNAGAAILINAKSGEILFEKNSEMEIPPASMTKLFLIYGVLEKARRGEISLDDTIQIDERAIASKMPPRSSLMFLGRGQSATIKELLQGMSVASGNDAATQIAISLYGSMENFIAETNSLIKSLGLEKTVVVEPSGYSESNITTPREMTRFCKFYIEEFPSALGDFHSMRAFSYPNEHNLPESQRGRGAQNFSSGIPDEIWTRVTFKNTNSLLGVLDGCDGIKTGHITESGFNIALTTIRDNMRYISVTMLGPGATMIEGDALRSADGIAIHEWAHENFSEFSLDDKAFEVPLYGSTAKRARLVPAIGGAHCIPKAELPAKLRPVLPAHIFGEVEQCATYGKLIVEGKDGRTLFEIPLVAEKSSAAAAAPIRFVDKIILRAKASRTQ